MPDIDLDPQALSGYVPHRGVNLIPDRVVLHDGLRTSTSWTRIPRGDARGRELLGRDDGRGGRAWIEPFLVELMALTGVPLLAERLRPQGQEAVFSSISRISFHRLAPMEGEVTGHAEITRDRGPFIVFSTRAEIDGQPLLEAEVMSGAAAMVDVAGKPVRPWPQAPGGEPIAPWAWKARSLRFVDSVVAADATARSLRAAYTYPGDHPFVPGHFPKAALMMGVTQWTAVADAAWEAARRFGLAGAPVLAAGRVLRPDGGEVLDVRDLRLEPGPAGGYVLASTKRIAFREPVRPGDGLAVEVQVQPA